MNSCMRAQDWIPPGRLISQGSQPCDIRPVATTVVKEGFPGSEEALFKKRFDWVGSIWSDECGFVPCNLWPAKLAVLFRRAVDSRQIKILNFKPLFPQQLFPVLFESYRLRIIKKAGLFFGIGQGT